MLGPNATFAFVIATLVGALFHLLAGGGVARLSLFLLAGWAGFGLGQVAGVSFSLDFLAIGDLHIVPALAGSFLALLVAHIFSSQRKPSRRTR